MQLNTVTDALSESVAALIPIQESYLHYKSYGAPLQLSDPVPGTACKEETKDTDCKDVTGMTKCYVDAGFCGKPDANKDCFPVKEGFSLTDGGQCVADCKNADTSKPGVNVGGLHDLSGTCTVDTAKKCDP